MWYKKLGYDQNPLSIKPTQNENLIGYERILQRIIYQVKIGNVIFLEGSYGTGKSSILRAVRKHFSKNILYFNYAYHKNLYTKIMNTRSTMRKIFMQSPKELLLLVDEVNLANQKDFDFLYEFYIMDKVKSIVFAGTDFRKAPFNKAFKSDTKLYKLNDIQANLASAILDQRMPKQKFIASASAKKIFQASHANPREYLANLSDLFARAIAKKQKKITPKDIDEFFSKKK
ncbi:MAG: hypothetical protein ACMXYE_05485 [Candidatus Woesearchaeota archaeon]